MSESIIWGAIIGGTALILIALAVGINMGHSDTAKRMKAHGYIHITVNQDGVWCKPEDAAAILADPVEAKP